MAGLYPVMEAQRMVPPQDPSQSYGAPVNNDSTQKNPKPSEHVPAGTSTSTAAPVLPVYASQPSRNQCGMSTIAFATLFMAFLIAAKFMLIVGRQEMPQNVCWIIAGALFFFFMFLFCLDGNKHEDLKILHLPCFGAQVIQLAGILAFLGYHFYGYFKKGDILYAYKYNIDNGYLLCYAILFWLFDVLAAIWVLDVVYRCYAYVNRLNKNHQSAAAYNIK